MAIRTPLKAIRAKCLDCCCNQAVEVRLCAAENCPLWEYRMGHRPKEDKCTAEDMKTEKTEAYP